MNPFILRHYIELFRIVISHQVQQNELVESLDITQKTLNADLSAIEDLGQMIGIKVQYNGDLITYKIVDEELFNRYYQDCCVFYYSHDRLSDNTVFNRYMIINMMLSSDEYISTEKIAESLGYSKSNLRSEIRYARDFLNSYHIRVINVPYHGMKIEYGEFDYRVCRTNVHSIVSNPELIGQEKMRYFDTRYRNALRTKIFEIFRQFGLHFDFDHCSRLIYYILIQKERNEQGHGIDKLSGHYIERLAETVEYQAACQICKEMDYEMDTISEDEIYSLAILLTVWQDYHQRQGQEEWQEKQDNDFYEPVKRYLTERWHIDMDRQDICLCLMEDTRELSLRKRFGMLSYNDVSIFGRNRPYSYYPIIRTIIKQMKEYLSDLCGERISGSVLLPITTTIYEALMFTKMDYKKQNLVVAMYSGTVKAQGMANAIMNWLRPAYVNQISVVNLDDIMYNNLFEQYDLVISDVRLIEGMEDCHTIRYESFYGIPEDMMRCLYKGLQLQAVEPEIIQSSFLPEVSVDELEVRVREDLDREVSGSGTKFEKQIHIQLRQPDTMFINHRKAFIILKEDSESGRDALFFYSLKKSLTFSRKSVDAFVILVFHPNMQKIKYYETLFFLIAEDRKKYAELLEKPTQETIREIVSEKLFRGNAY